VSNHRCLQHIRCDRGAVRFVYDSRDLLEGGAKDDFEVGRLLLTEMYQYIVAKMHSLCIEKKVRSKCCPLSVTCFLSTWNLHDFIRRREPLQVVL